MKILSKGKYYGAKKLEVDCKGILLSEYDYDLPQTDWHYHENPYFMYVLKGAVYDNNKKDQSRCPAGSLLFHNWQEVHQNKNALSNTGGFHIEFERSWFEKQQLDINLWEGSQVIKNPNLHHVLAKLYFEFKTQDQFSSVSIETLLLQLCENIPSKELNQMEKTPTWIGALRELLHEVREDFSLAYLSKELGVHPVHISRSIPKYFSVTLGEYLRRQKIQRSLGYIVEGKYSLTEIAHLSGFADQSHFIRTFKKYFGHTPKVYRQGIK